MSTRSFGDLRESHQRCSALTRYFVGESCHGLTRIKAFGLWFAFIFITLSLCLLFAYGMMRVAFAWSSSSTSLQVRTGSNNAPVPPTPKYSWSDYWGAFKWGGMARYQDIKAAVEVDRKFKERVAKDGWDSVEIPIIPGFNCAESREKERREWAELAKLPKGKDEEEAGADDVGSPSKTGKQLDTLRSQRGGRLSPELSDDDLDKQINAKGFGKGSSNSRNGSSQKSSQRKRSRRNR